jgi:hypothetical protein
MIEIVRNVFTGHLLFEFTDAVRRESAHQETIFAATIFRPLAVSKATSVPRGSVRKSLLINDLCNYDFGEIVLESGNGENFPGFEFRRYEDRLARPTLSDQSQKTKKTNTDFPRLWRTVAETT